MQFGFKGMGAMHTLKAVALALTVLACGGTDVSGTWNGTASVAGSSESIKLTLNQDEDNVTGSGTLTGPAASLALTVTGTAKDDDVALTVATSGFSDAHYDATLDGDSMNGTWTEPGFTGAVTFTRE